MKLYYILIDGYKNLEHMEVNFEVDSSINALIGNNGSGKSNLLEALTIIFSKVKSGLEVEFGFRVKYRIDDNDFEIGNLRNGTTITKNGSALSKARIVEAIPKSVFLYYCGETARLKEFALEYVDTAFEKALKTGEDVVLKFITYLTVEDFGAALVADYVFKDYEWLGLFNVVGIKSIHLPFILNLKRPAWGKYGTPEALWNARGVVADSINKLLSVSGNARVHVIDQDNASISISDINKLKEYWHSALDLFMVLKMLLQADILKSIEFDVSKEDGYIYSYMNLSEGEKQMSMLISLLAATREYKALFLLDEFDSYLHPNWQRKFTDMIKKINIRGQVLFTTHSPLTLGMMKKDNIVLLKEGSAYTPAVDTYNRDITEVLEELMDVEKRPEEATQVIIAFRNAVAHGNKEEAYKQHEELKKILSEDDPFFITARINLKQLERR